MSGIRAAVYRPLSVARPIIRLLMFVLSGLLVIGGAGCVVIYFQSGDPRAVGAAALLICFGMAGLLVALFYDHIGEESAAGRLESLYLWNCRSVGSRSIQ